MSSIQELCAARDAETMHILTDLRGELDRLGYFTGVTRWASGPSLDVTIGHERVAISRDEHGLHIACTEHHVITGRGRTPQEVVADLEIIATGKANCGGGHCQGRRYRTSD